VGGPYVLRDGKRLRVPEGSKRLLVFLALNGGRAYRRYVAGALWPDGGDSRASGNLRSALWRLREAGVDVVDADKATLALRPGLEVDVDTLSEWAARITEGDVRYSDVRIGQMNLEALDLLPGWYDDWVIFERERLRQRMLHALEALSRHLVETGRWGEAVEAAMTAVSVEPLRESAQRLLVEAHLAEGNLVEARRSFAHYCVLLRAELDVEPGSEFVALAYRCGLATTNGRTVLRPVKDISPPTPRRREGRPRGEMKVDSGPVIRGERPGVMANAVRRVVEEGGNGPGQPASSAR
jgi:DNA-binding SARP family transcriptional activator